MMNWSVLCWLHLHRCGLSGTHRRVCTAGGRALGVAAGHVHAAGVGTRRGSRTQRLGLERVRRLLGVDGRRLGGGGFLPRHALARRGQALERRRLWPWRTTVNGRD